MDEKCWSNETASKYLGRACMLPESIVILWRKGWDLDMPEGRMDGIHVCFQHFQELTVNAELFWSCLQFRGGCFVKSLKYDSAFTKPLQSTAQPYVRWDKSIDDTQLHTTGLDSEVLHLSIKDSFWSRLWVRGTKGLRWGLHCFNLKVCGAVRVLVFHRLENLPALQSSLRYSFLYSSYTSILLIDGRICSTCVDEPVKVTVTLSKVGKPLAGRRQELAGLL